MYASTPALSARKLEEQIAGLQTALGRLGTAGADWGALTEIAERLAILRRQYVAHRERLGGYVPRLTLLRQQLDALLSTHLTRVVDHFHELGEQMRRAETEREFLREYFIRRAGDASLELAGVRAQVTVKATPGITMPASGSDTRAKLEDLLKASGRWPEVSQLARARLLRALDGRQFTPQQEQEIGRLCPRTISHQVITRLRA